MYSTLGHILRVRIQRHLRNPSELTQSASHHHVENLLNLIALLTAPPVLDCFLLHNEADVVKFMHEACFCDADADWTFTFTNGSSSAPTLNFMIAEVCDVR